jgi:glycosyltransferase involved in cell wall biosynthesis
VVVGDLRDAGALIMAPRNRVRSAASMQPVPTEPGDRTAGAGLRVLFLAFYFPPLGGGGVQRAVKFAKYLPEFGCQPVVVTGSARSRTRHAPLDASLGREGPPEACVFRAERALPEDFRVDRMRRLLGRPSRFAEAWATECEATGLRAASEAPIDVVLATMSPFETSLAASRLAQRLGVPWVADLRDPWALDEMIVYPTRWHRALEMRRMRRCLSSAARVIMNTPQAALAVRSSFPELADRTISITNGFDLDDFLGEPPDRKDPRFRIVHTGSLHVTLGDAHRRRRWLRRWTGGERVSVDIMTRSHVYLLRALERWRAQFPDEADRAELVLAGEVSAADRAAVERSAVANLVEMPGYLSHADSVALLRSADLLFLPMHALPRGECAHIVPGKTYEYLAAKRPILAAVPEGDARDFVRASGLGEICDPDDVDAMVASLHRRFECKRNGERPVPAAPDFYRQFERRELARQLAAALRAAAGTTQQGYPDA